MHPAQGSGRPNAVSGLKLAVLMVSCNMINGVTELASQEPWQIQAEQKPLAT